LSVGPFSASDTTVLFMTYDLFTKNTGSIWGDLQRGGGDALYSGGTIPPRPDRHRRSLERQRYTIGTRKPKRRDERRPNVRRHNAPH
jgi:hypothetical protein